MRKPRGMSWPQPSFLECDEHGDKREVFVDHTVRTVEQLRSDAAWLLKAADWLEEKEGEK